MDYYSFVYGFHGVGICDFHNKKDKKGFIRMEIDYETLAKRLGIEPGWAWLYLNSYKWRVPEDIRGRIEDELEQMRLARQIEDIEI